METYYEKKIGALISICLFRFNPAIVSFADENMKWNTRCAIIITDTRHMILMFAMFMSSAILFDITIFANRKRDDKLG